MPDFQKLMKDPIAWAALAAVIVAIVIAIVMYRKRKAAAAATTAAASAGIMVTKITYGNAVQPADKYAKMFAPTTGVWQKVTPDGVFGDPQPGIAKTMTVEYTSNGAAKTYSWKDGGSTIANLAA